MVFALYKVMYIDMANAMNKIFYIKCFKYSVLVNAVNSGLFVR